ncbi:MAG: capsule biosynthesis protein [Hyphomicrobiales bacterium]
MNRNRAGKRHFLLLQGPCGAFYRDLQKALEARGHVCTNVVINGGDFVDARLGKRLIFRRSFADWPAWLTAAVLREHVTDIVLYGDCRPYHRTAGAAVRPLGVAVHVLEEGYLRPNWITCERDGVNGNSRFVDLDLEDIDDAVLAAGEPAPETDFVGSQLRYMLAGINYYFCSLILTPFFPRYEAHRDLDILGEAALWLGRFAGWPKRRLETRRALKHIARLGKPVHMVLLQLNGDSQIKDHSGFGSVRHFVEFCIAEFAASGSTDTVLVFKNHPLDNGVINLSKLIRDEAARSGLKDRVFFIDTGKLVPLLHEAISVTAVNSTACHQSLRRGIATLVLGKAVYNHPEIVPRMRLADFFRMRPVGRLEHYERLVKLLRLTCQVNGSYYGKAGRKVALGPLCDLLINGAVPLEAFLKSSASESRTEVKTGT